VWNRSTVHGSGLITASSELMTAVGIGWGSAGCPGRLTTRGLRDPSSPRRVCTGRPRSARSSR
jgi:hypothetical protein